jgi:hypothetical protein
VSYAQAGVVIDNFATAQDPVVLITTMTGQKESDCVSGSGIFGGTRCLEVEVVETDGSSVIVTIMNGELELSNASGVQALVRLTYSLPTDEGRDLTAGGTKDWFIFETNDIDNDLLVTVALTDTDDETGINTYFKLEPDSSKTCPGFTGGLCPAIVYPIGATLPAGDGPPEGSVPGNFFHGLEAFVSGGTDPVTGVAFPGPANGALTLASINTVVITFDSDGADLDLNVGCIHSGAGPVNKGADTVFTTADGVTPSPQCNVVPEPGSLLLLGTGMLGLGFVGMRTHFSRRRQQQA